MTELYSNFPTRWERSQKGVEFVAEKLWERGHNVFIGSQELAKTLEEAKDYIDDGDIFILTKADKDLRVEVKWLETTEFTGKEDYPYFEFMICETRSFGNADPKPDVYIILEKFKRAIGVVDVGKTKKHWYWKYKMDWSRTEDGKRQFYFCTLNHVEWVTF